MTLLPPHDRINCNICFDNKSIQWGKTEREVNGWKIEANAEAWGNRNPTILVLGVSKGPNQTRATSLKNLSQDISKDEIIPASSFAHTFDSHPFLFGLSDHI